MLSPYFWISCLLALAIDGFAAELGEGQAPLSSPASASASPKAAQVLCSKAPPIPQVAATSFYSDRAGSKVDPTALSRNLVEIEPLRTFVTGLLRDIDGQQSPCASAKLRDWANANALLKQPTNFEGVRERLRFTFALNMAAIRLAALGHPPDSPTKEWLSQLNLAVVRDFRIRARLDNLYVWSGATAATGAMLTHDAQLRAHSQRVWAKATRFISTDGTIPSELRRETRSALYHAYYLSALLTLEAAGVDATDSQQEAVRRLFAQVRRYSCGGDRKGGDGAQGGQEPINPDDLATIEEFGSRYGHLCGLERAKKYDPLRGGDPATALLALHNLGRGGQGVLRKGSRT